MYALCLLARRASAASTEVVSFRFFIPLLLSNYPTPQDMSSAALWGVADVFLERSSPIQQAAVRRATVHARHVHGSPKRESMTFILVLRRVYR